MIAERRSSPWPGTAKCPGERRSRRHPRRPLPGGRCSCPAGGAGHQTARSGGGDPCRPGPCLRPSGSIRPPREWPTPRPYGPSLCRAVHPRPSRPPPSPTTRATTSWCWPGQFHCGGSASTICCRSPAWPMSATCRATASSGFPSSPGWSSTLRHDLRSRSGSPSRSPTGWIGNWTPGGSAVVLDAEHTCMTMRGVQAVGARTVTSALRGLLRDSPSSRAEFFALTGVPTDGRPAHPSAAAPKA